MSLDEFMVHNARSNQRLSTPIKREIHGEGEEEEEEEDVHPMNVIDLEFSRERGPMAMLKGPDVVTDASLGHMYLSLIEGRAKDNPVEGCSNYLILSEAGSVTNFHVDFTGTSVCYSMLAGKKYILFLLPTTQNMRLLRAWEDREGDGGKESMNFFGTLQGVEGYVTVMELQVGDVVFIPAQMIHCVITVEPSIVLGQNFVMDVHLSRTIMAFRDEVAAGVDFDECLPCFLPLMLCHLANAYMFGNSIQHIQGHLLYLISKIDQHVKKTVIANIIAAMPVCYLDRRLHWEKLKNWAVRVYNGETVSGPVCDPVAEGVSSEFDTYSETSTAVSVPLANRPGPTDLATTTIKRASNSGCPGPLTVLALKQEWTDTFSVHDEDDGDDWARVVQGRVKQEPDDIQRATAAIMASLNADGAVVAAANADTTDA